MTLRCEAGDLAVIVGSELNDGRLVECLHFVGVMDARLNWGLPCWEVEPLDGFPLKWTRLHRGNFVPDACLKPLRDPGEDAKDNAWDWLPPVPSKEHA